MTNKQYLLDTNILIDFLKEVPSVVEKILQIGTHHCCISVLSLHELYYGHFLPERKEKITISKNLTGLILCLNISRC